MQISSQENCGFLDPVPGIFVSADDDGLVIPSLKQNKIMHNTMVHFGVNHAKSMMSGSEEGEMNVDLVS